MCVGVEPYKAVSDYLTLTFIPDAMCSIALKYIKPRGIPPLSYRGITVCVLSLGYVFLGKDECIGTAAFLYGALLQAKSIYDLGKVVLPNYLNYQSLEDEISDKLNVIRTKMNQLNQKNIGTKPFNKRYTRLVERFNHVSPDTINEIRNDTYRLFSDLSRYIYDKLPNRA